MEKFGLKIQKHYGVWRFVGYIFYFTNYADVYKRIFVPIDDDDVLSYITAKIIADKIGRGVISIDSLAEILEIYNPAAKMNKDTKRAQMLERIYNPVIALSKSTKCPMIFVTIKFCDSNGEMHACLEGFNDPQQHS